MGILLIGLNTELKAQDIPEIPSVKSIDSLKTTIAIEHLTFTEEDFFTEDGEYKYNNEDEAEKLPWRDLHLVLDELSGIKQFVYSYNLLIEGTNTFETKTLTSDVFVKAESQRLKIDNIFFGDDRYSKPEGDVYLGDYENGDLDLYPLDEGIYRVVGQEELTIGLGTFNCTVVEALSYDKKLKIWFMNDKPAIIVKVIKELRETPQYSIYEIQDMNEKGEDYNSHYSIYELQEIK